MKYRLYKYHNKLDPGYKWEGTVEDFKKFLNIIETKKGLGYWDMKDKKWRRTLYLKLNGQEEIAERLEHLNQISEEKLVYFIKTLPNGNKVVCYQTKDFYMKIKEEFNLGLENYEEKNDSVKQKSHASPREHTRQGHWRKYRSGKLTWINRTIVNKSNR